MVTGPAAEALFFDKHIALIPRRLALIIRVLFKGLDVTIEYAVLPVIIITG